MENDCFFSLDRTKGLSFFVHSWMCRVSRLHQILGSAPPKAVCYSVNPESVLFCSRSLFFSLAHCSRRSIRRRMCDQSTHRSEDAGTLACAGSLGRRMRIACISLAFPLAFSLSTSLSVVGSERLKKMSSISSSLQPSLTAPCGRLLPCS